MTAVFAVTASRLEADHRTDVHLQIVASSTQEVNVIASFQADANRSRKSFNTNARIHRKASTTIGDIRHAAHKPRGRRCRGMAERDESYFGGEKRSEGTVSSD